MLTKIYGAKLKVKKVFDFNEHLDFGFLRTQCVAI